MNPGAPRWSAMPSIAPSKPTTTTRVARVPYLNSVPFFQGLVLGEAFELTDGFPRELGQQAAAGQITAGLVPVADYFRLQDRFERVGPFGIAVRGRAHSVLLFARRPIRQLDGASIALTAESSSSVALLRLLLGERYGLTPRYVEGPHPARPGSGDSRAGDADAVLLIGDEALRVQQSNTQYPFETDIAFEWWLWQHLPFVFAVWVIRKDAASGAKKELEQGLSRCLGLNTKNLPSVAAECALKAGMTPEQVYAYLANFIYRLSRPEEEGIVRFQELLGESGLL